MYGNNIWKYKFYVKKYIKPSCSGILWIVFSYNIVKKLKLKCISSSKIIKFWKTNRFKTTDIYSIVAEK